MTVSPSLVRWTVSLALVAVGVAGFVAGMRLGSAASEPGVNQLRFVDPSALETTAESAARSAGGLTGFGGAPALTGDVLGSGVFGDTEAGLLRIEQSSRSLEIAYQDGTRLFRITPASAPLVPGDRVVVRTEDDQVTGVLRVTD